MQKIILDTNIIVSALISKKNFNTKNSWIFQVNKQLKIVLNIILIIFDLARQISED